MNPLDLSKFSISSDEEKLTQELKDTHLALKKTLPMFSIEENKTTKQETQYLPQPTCNDKDDGWGEGPPSYTAILQGTYFGFNSVLHNSTIKKDNSTAAQEAFSRFKDKPVSFTSHLNK
ncbi:hypothetical protein CU097_014641 [Rhizopus azygosporus]|uniref:Uncharacterized protein n=1 Tax=Rhizopus azygosporus TaxID=86630 RepID=A0A367K979_RHIAZ|nr:hypothetical protein CU097_014641 [Rhizopus azygosporus]